jgi:thiol:disulfide interchange protein
METLRQLMAFPLLATVVWLLWVFALQAGTDALAVALAGLLVASFGMWLAGRLSASANPTRTRWAGAIAAATLIAGFAWALPARDAAASIEQVGHASEGGWIPYSAERLEREREQGRPIYVDFTASWCLTCQVNKKVVFGSEEVLTAFRQHGVILMRGDWTDRDPEITRALASFGRSGVPLNVFYGDDPGEEPIVLSTVLTPSRVLDALEDILEH